MVGYASLQAAGISTELTPLSGRIRLGAVRRDGCEMAIQAWEDEEAGADERAADFSVRHDARLGLDVRKVGVPEEEDAEDHAGDGGRDNAFRGLGQHEKKNNSVRMCFFFKR